MGSFGSRAWRSDSNMFSCLEERDDDVSSCSDMEDDNADKSSSL